MIYIDDRIGSKELHPKFPKGSARLTYLQYADFMFTGHYADGDVLVGIERKRIGDLISGMTTGRIAGKQLIGLLNSYHYIYLVVEGEMRANPRDGLLEVKYHGHWCPYKAGKRTFMARDVWAYLNTLEIVCGLHCHYCPVDMDTVYYIMALHHWWAKEYEEHRSHLQAHQRPGPVQLTKQSVFQRMVGQMDGIGFDKAKALDRRFDSISALISATRNELMEVDGIGKKLSEDIIKQLWGL